MASLSGVSIASSYTSLLKLNGNTDSLVAGDGSNAIQVVDGDGTTSPLFLNTDRLGIGGQPTQALDVSGNILASGASAPSITATDTTNTTSIQMRALDSEVRFGSVTNHPVKMGANSSTTGLVIDTSNNIGIGVSSGISAKLHIDTPTDGNTIQFDRSGQETYKLFHGTSGLFLSKPDSTGVAVALVTQDGDFYTKDSSDNFLLFSDTSTSRVGISTNSPASKLHIGSRGTASALSPSGDGLIFDFYNIGNPYTRFGTIISNSADASEAKLSFWTTASSSTASEKMVIDGAGNVGIGTSPARQLHVHGADGGQVDGLHITNTDTGATSGDGFTIGLDANENAFFFGRESGKRIDFYTSSTKRFSIDDNSRISLSNNDAGNNNNTIFGKNAGLNIDDGSQYNTFIGDGVSDASMDNAISNVGVGFNALTSLTSGDQNVAIGTQALNDVSTGSDNIAIGTQASFNLTTGNLNVVIGTQALHTATDSSNIVAIGLYAGLDINDTAADGSVLIGRSAGENITSGSGNTAIGYQALDATTTQDNSTAIGYNAGGASAGNSNLFVGYNAGATGTNDVVSGTQNTIVGTSARASSSSAQGQIVLGVGAEGQGDHTAVIGGSAVTDVYMAQDSGATVHCAGINFSATQPAPNAGTSTSEVLDSYEEGTWTPVYDTKSDDLSNFSMHSSVGHYTKIGNMVTVFVTMSTTGAGSISSSSDNDIVIEGLPFTCNSTQRNVSAIVAGRFQNAPDRAIVASGTTEIELRKNFETNLKVGDFTASASSNQNVLELVITYFV